MPSILEFFSHSFFVGGYFVGPQFCMKKYQDYIQANIDGGVKQSPVPFGLRRLAIGWGYMLFHLIGSGVVGGLNFMRHVLGCGFPVSFEFPPLPGKPSSVCLATELRKQSQ